MKKLTLFGGALLVAAGIQVVGAKLVGANLEAPVREAVDAYSDVMGYPYEVTRVKTGWFSSDVTVRLPIAKALLTPLKGIGISPDGKNGTPPYFDLDIHLTHGPVIWNDGLHFGLAYAEARSRTHAANLAAKLITAKKPEERQLLTLFVSDLIRAAGPDFIVKAHFDGSIDLTARIHGGKAALRQQAEGGADATSLSLRLEPAKSHLHLSGGAKKILTSDTEFGGMTLDLSSPGAKAYVEMGDISMHGSYVPLAPALWSGEATLKVAPINLTLHHGDKPVLIRIARITSHSKSHSGMAGKDAVLSADATLTLPGATVTVDDNTLTLGKLEIAGSGKNILVDLAARELQMRKALAARGELQDPGKPFAVVDAKDFASLVERQVEARPELIIDHYSLENAAGESNLAGHVGLKADTTASVLESPAALASAIKGSFTVTLDPKMLKELMFEAGSLGPQKPTQAQTDQHIDAMLHQYTQVGLLKPEGDAYTSQVEIADNMIIVNGKPLRPLYLPRAVSKQAPIAAPAPDAHKQ